jgi:hypothetical protein
MKSLAAAVLAAAAVALAPQDPGPDPAMLQRSKQLSLPTEHHTRLQKLLGEWDVTVSTTLPGQPAREDRGRLVAASILGGRFMVLNFTLELQGAKVEAVQLLGFDTLRQLYTASWRDSLSTWPIDCAGAPVAATPDVIVMTGLLTDARDPEGRPFRLELDLTKDKAVTARTFETAGDTKIEVQVQHWVRKG